jgi:hypothetical protein
MEATMAASKLPDIDFVRECLDYDPDSGVFRWRARPQHHFLNPESMKRMHARDAGRVAGSKHISGRHNERIYWGIRLAGIFYPAHRIAWLLIYRIDPTPLEIDHINGDGLDNRIANLRLATRAENASNARRALDNISGTKGVQSNGNGYMARIRVHGKQHYLGTFRTLEEAVEARRKAADELHGVFARHK